MVEHILQCKKKLNHIHKTGLILSEIEKKNLKHFCTGAKISAKKIECPNF